ncbi:MAG: ABC transporter ATP-binding protein [Candidatus Omnitrophica bacterium]|nr:ABC transporter ATP-binding protein [Candidatus Omnitrophota bacterium]MBU4488383.1 ABC transporter ATP-binding protein [Candidatus Omnitrophota bacterium]MCG2705018.1 ABC transporter ATP-binding protein [Candidatus Omnitrophota bacterium]
MTRELLLRVDDLSGGYGKENIVRDISFVVNKGDFLGIIGPNGSGKSTLLRFLSRVLVPRKGRIELSGKDIHKMALKEFSRKTAFVPQDILINFSFTVWEIALMGRIPHLGRLELETRNDFTIAEKALSLTDALYLKEKYIDNLSAGERQRVIIAKALAQEPILLLLDEPTSHLDIGYQIQILDLLKKLNREKGLSIIMVLHDLNLASEYCDRIILLNEGSIFKEGSPHEVLTYENIESVYKTVVLVNKNPLSSKPFITIIPGEDRCKQN